MIHCGGNQPGAGRLVTFKGSNWLMSILLADDDHLLPATFDSVEECGSGSRGWHFGLYWMRFGGPKWNFRLR
jgi:myosin-crossreactive antigen